MSICLADKAHFAPAHCKHYAQTLICSLFAQRKILLPLHLIQRAFFSAHSHQDNPYPSARCRE